MGQNTEKTGAPPRIVVVGTCASGKSTLVSELRARGYDAHSCAQEHSAIPELWNHSWPDLLIYLDVDLATVRRRRSAVWPESIFRAQLQRLERARATADIVIGTGRIGPDESVGLVEALVSERFPHGASRARSGPGD